MRVGVSLSVYLKVHAALQGVRLADELADSLDRLSSPQTRADGGRSIIARLPGAVTLSAAIESESAAALVLSGTPGAAQLSYQGASVPAELVVPAFYGKVTTAQRPMWQVAAALGSVIAVNPSVSCSFALRGAPCRFCRAGTPVAAAEGFPMPVVDVVETVRAAFDEGIRGPVYFNTGFLGGDDSGIAFLEPYIRAVKRNFPTLVAVQMHPPRTNQWIDRTYAMGVDALSYAIEIYDPNVLQRLCPGRVRFIGRERYYEALAYAATIFPRGTVWSDLVVGIEPPDSTRRGVETLVRDGVLPVLSTLRTAMLSQLRGVVGVSNGDEMALFAELSQAAETAGLPMGWVRDLAFAITPFEARALVTPEEEPARAETFYRRRLHDLAARNLSRLRRRLRVRQIDDSSHVGEA